MLAALKDKSDELCGTLLVEPFGECVSCPEEHHVTAGSGACRACRREGKTCGGYISTGYSPYACKTCGHAYDQHE
ncbi:MAG: hypothetical protein WCB27_08415 [Thermoguttaceae bacterium]